MKRWWKGVAAAAAWLGLTVGASGQTMSPSPVGAARMPEPVRYDAGPMPNLVPGPITPQMAPAGPGPELDLTARHSNAFPVEKFSVEESCYFHFGGQWLRRQRVEPISAVYLDFGPPADLIPRTAATLPLIGDAGTSLPAYALGPRATLGYLLGNWGVEVSGFWMPETEGSRLFQSQGRLTTNFSLPNGAVPPGFSDATNNSIFEKADQVRLAFRSTLAGAEANCRTWNGGLNQLDFIVGVRSLFLGETLDFQIFDDGLTLDAFGASDATRAATYRSRIQTGFLGLQFGSEYSYLVPCTCGVVWLHGMGKVALGANYITRTLTLSRGDGANALREHDDTVKAGGLFDLQAGLDFHILERLRLRAAYQAFWLTGTTTPSAQLDYRLEAQGTRGYGSKTILYHGPQLELMFLF